MRSCSHLTASKCPCPKEIKKAQHGPEWKGDEKDSAQLPHPINELEIPSRQVKALTRVNTNRYTHARSAYGKLITSRCKSADQYALRPIGRK